SRDRIAGGVPGFMGAPGRAWLLRIAPLMLALPLVWGLLSGNVGDVVALAVGLAVIYLGAFLLESGLVKEAEYQARELANAPRPPRKLLGAIVVGIGVFVCSLGASGAGVALSLLLGALAGVGCLMTYGMDPTRNKGLAPELARKAGVKTGQVIEAVTEAEGKLREIERLAGGLHNRELTDRLGRIVAQARAVLAQIEKDPSDLRRARRFLVTYLDGTRDVVRKYTEQQQDLAETELAANFRHVLETIERVFTEQEQVLKRNETMDLEVQIEVLRTQLEREGVA
ncbi:MAG: 5-bromo-4-chloroindolyl phosphate hydrolysis family protein, partial [Geminicoccaceae bacterium]